jgi:hypothetical protein
VVRRHRVQNMAVVVWRVVEDQEDPGFEVGW